MSLINQVLQNVEARQGTLSLASEGQAVWQGAQVKPVLGGDAQTSGWRVGGLRLKTAAAVALLLCVAAGWGLPRVSHWVVHAQGNLISTPSTTTIHAAAVTHATTVTHAASGSAAEAASAPKQEAWVASTPGLTRSLFSDWQPSLSAKRSVQRDPSTAAASREMLQPQREGEFSIQAAPAVEIPAVSSALLTKAEAPDSASGSVSKQLRPDQEVNVLIQRAVDHEQKGRLSEAIALCRQALETTPQSEDARLLLATYLFETKQDNEAVAVLQAGLRQYPMQAGLARSLARWQLAHAQPDQVIQTLKPLQAALAQDAEAQWMLAMAYQQSAQHAAALPHFEQATRLRPASAPWLVAYALSLQAVGQSAQALQQLELAQGLPMSERMQTFVAQRIRQLSGS